MLDREAPSCRRKTCFACAKESEICMLLTDTNFGKRECPFYKTRETYRLDREQAERRLTRIGYRGKEDGNDGTAAVTA